MSANGAIGTSMIENAQHGAQPQRKHGRWMLSTVVVIALLGLALLVGWLPHHTRNKAVNARARQQQNTLPIVEVQAVHNASSEQEVTLPGTVTPLRAAHIYARVSGYFKARYVDLGDTVRKGQLLGIISVPELDSSVVQQAALVRQSKDTVSTAQATLRLQQATYTRVHTLVLHGILSNQEDDATLAALESAQSNLQAMENAEKGAEAALAREQSLADFEQVRSPINGTITARNVEVGNLVSASGAAQGLDPVLPFRGVRVPVQLTHMSRLEDDQSRGNMLGDGKVT
jgi:multidrug efflux pump subunit AcrA (membrane-fusion protein)